MDDVSEYIESLPEPRRAAVRHLNDVVSAAVPELTPELWDYSGKLIGYGRYHYRGKSGREGDWFILGLANRKNYISLYSMGIRDGTYLVELYQPRLPGTRTGRSCINITRPDRLDDGVVSELARETYDLFKSELVKG